MGYQTLIERSAAAIGHPWTPELHVALVEHLAQVDRLAQDVIRRDPTRFRVLLEGRRGMGGLYGLWQRRRFAPDHDPRARQG